MFFKKIMIIVNPRAGMGRGEKLLKEIENWKEKILKEKGIKTIIETTERFGQRNACSLAEEAVREKYDLVIAVGGDGTVNEVANGLVHSKVPLALVMAGSGNDFAKNFKIPKNIEQALNIAIYGDIKFIDVGEANGRIFTNIFSVGFDAWIAKQADILRIKLPFLPRQLIYVIALFKELLFKKIRYSSLEVKIFKDENNFEIFRGRTTLIAVANGKVYGGGFKIAPDADLEDGFFDICLIEKIKRTKILKFLPKVIKGTHLVVKEIKKENGKLPKAHSLIISNFENKNLIAEMDGEILPPLKEYKITILPQALKIMVPKIPRFKPRDLLF